jgi:hypothetical protein
VMSAEWSEVLAGSDVGRLVGGWSEDPVGGDGATVGAGLAEWSAAEWSAVAMLGNWSEDCRRIHTAGRSTSRSTGRCGDVGGVSTGYGDVETGRGLVGGLVVDRPECWRQSGSEDWSVQRWALALLAEIGRRRCWATGRRTVGGYVGDRW